MGANLEYKKLTEARKKIIDDILYNIRQWNGDLQAGIDLVNNNSLEIERIKNINEKISLMDMPIHDDEYKEKLNSVYNEQKKLFETLEKIKRDLLNERQQLNKKDKIVENYIKNDKKPIFIDRNFS